MDKPREMQAETTEAEQRQGERAQRRVERARRVKEYRASGLTQAQFAAKSGLKVGTLRTWIYKKPASSRGEAGGFAPVRIIADKAQPTAKSRGLVTVRWPQGIEVELAVDLDGDGVQRLVCKLLAPCLR